MGIDKVETSVCLKYKKKKHIKKSNMLLDAEFMSINILHQLSLNSVGFCVLLCSWHLIVQQLILFSHWLQQDLGGKPKNINAVGLWFLFLLTASEVFTWKNLVLEILSDLWVNNFQLCSSSWVLLWGWIGTSNMCQSCVPCYWLKEMWGRKVHSWDFRIGKQTVHHRCVITVTLVWCTSANIKVPQVSSLTQSVQQP